MEVGGDEAMPFAFSLAACPTPPPLPSTSWAMSGTGVNGPAPGLTGIPLAPCSSVSVFSVREAQAHPRIHKAKMNQKKNFIAFFTLVLEKR